MDSGRASSSPLGATGYVSKSGVVRGKGHTLLDSLGDLGWSGGVGDVTVLFGWVYLVGVDILVGVGVVDLKVRLFYVDR